MALSQQTFKLRHLFGEHAIKHLLLVAHLLSELLLKGVLKHLQLRSLRIDGLLKMSTLLVQLHLQLLKLTAAFMCLLCYSLLQLHCLCMEIRDLFFQCINPARPFITIHLHRRLLWELCQDS